MQLIAEFSTALHLATSAWPAFCCLLSPPPIITSLRSYPIPHGGSPCASASPADAGPTRPRAGARLINDEPPSTTRRQGPSSGRLTWSRTGCTISPAKLTPRADAINAPFYFYDLPTLLSPQALTTLTITAAPSSSCWTPPSERPPHRYKAQLDHRRFHVDRGD